MPQTDVKILIVDDLPEKLLVYRSILEDRGLEIVTAVSGEDALRRLLVEEFAVILLDVNMPGMDGFETASMIRKRKRCAHMPIIFLTAHSDEMHSLRGYSYGAVDYILTPVVPDVLRTKVMVFAELYRKAQQVQQQADALRELEVREHRRQLRESHERLDLALVAGNMVACEWNGGDRLANWSPELPGIFGLPAADFDGSIFRIQSAVHPDDRERLSAALRNAFSVGGDFRIEHRVAHRDGRTSWVEMRGRLFPKEHLSAPRLVGVCMDITERKRIEHELDRHRARLEDLVLERTAELASSHERLRLADRLASIGTLAAGLGHDMGNLLLPVRMRLDALEEASLSPESREDLLAIAEACEYLKRLSHGLRLFALDPENAVGSGETVRFDHWWQDVHPFFRSTLARGVAIEHHIPSDIPAVRMPPHVLTQAVYNLLQNAGDAMQGRANGKVVISARLSRRQGMVDLIVTDNGGGMNEETRLRCMEPFFTTKTRGISTGFGLALVCGCVRSAGGEVDIESTVGVGTTFRLAIPCSRAESPQTVGTLAQLKSLACVDLGDARTSAYVTTVLESLGIRVVTGPWIAGMAARLMVIASAEERAVDVDAFLEADPARAAIVLGKGATISEHERVVRLSTSPSASDLRAALVSAVQSGEPLSGRS